MFKRADDPKSNAILNALAYIDFIRPKWVVFENVRGFLQFNLNAAQAGRHRLHGGIQMGGLKLLESGLIKMG
jgi:DNA (cytosine-5)-methyltransferase 1